MTQGGIIDLILITSCSQDNTQSISSVVHDDAGSLRGGGGVHDMLHIPVRTGGIFLLPLASRHQGAKAQETIKKKHKLNSKQI